MIPLLALLALTASPDPGGALASAADELAGRACAGWEPGTAALVVTAPGAAGLREPIETALAAAVGRRGFTAVPLHGADAVDPEKAARALPADLLLRVRAALSTEGLTLAAETIPTRPNFFLQRIDGARAGGGRLVTVRAPSGPALRALAAPRPTGALALVPLAVVDERVLALGAGPTEGGAARIVAVTATRVLLLDGLGAVLSSFALPSAPPGPRVRDRAATAAVGDFGAGRVAYATAGAPGGAVLSAVGDRLAAAGLLPAAPLASGAAGRLFGVFVPGRGLLADAIALRPDVSPSPRSARATLAAAAAPGPGRVAFGVLEEDYALRLLGADLAPAAPDVAGVGAGFALADVDGDGEAEVVASSAAPGTVDRVRVLRPGATADTAFISAPVEGSFVAGAAADLTGDGMDDAVLAAALPDGRARLWLLTADARRGRP